MFFAFCAWVFFFAAAFNVSGRATAPFESVGGVVISPMVSDAILRRFSRKSEIKRTWAKKREQVNPAPAVLYLRHMLMYGKEASNRKQEIDRQHYTIPNQRPKDKHCGKI